MRERRETRSRSLKSRLLPRVPPSRFQPQEARILADGGKQPQRASFQLPAMSVQLSASEPGQGHSEFLLSLAEADSELLSDSAP